MCIPQITQNSILDLVSPLSAFTDSNTCTSTLRALAAGDHRLVFSNITHNATIQQGFYNASKSSLGSFYCFDPNYGPLNQTFSPGLLGMGSGVPIATLRGGVDLNFQPDGNLVVYNNHAGQPAAVEWAAGSQVPGSNCSGLCELNFTSDGNLVVTYNGTEQWQSNSAGMGGTKLVATNQPPWLLITTSTGSVVWSTSQT